MQKNDVLVPIAFFFHPTLMLWKTSNKGNYLICIAAFHKLKGTSFSVICCAVLVVSELKLWWNILEKIYIDIIFKNVLETKICEMLKPWNFEWCKFVCCNNRLCWQDTFTLNMQRRDCLRMLCQSLVQTWTPLVHLIWL